MIPRVWLLRETSAEYRAAKRARGLCTTYRCKRLARFDGASRCHTCQNRLYRLQHPDRYAYNNLRCSAHKRDIPFELTFEEFQAFCEATGYLERKGKGDKDLSVDRIRTSEGYHRDNIRVLEYLANCSHQYEDGSAPADF